MRFDSRPEEAIEDLLAVLDLEEIDENIYRGRNEKRRPGRLFGGQVAAQALRAAGYTVEGTPAHSLHGYFLRPGDPAVPVRPFQASPRHTLGRKTVFFDPKWWPPPGGFEENHEKNV